MSRAFRLEPDQLSEKDVAKQCMTILALHHYLVIRCNAGIFRPIEDGKPTDCCPDGANPDLTLAEIFGASRQKAPRQRAIHGAEKGFPDYACLHGYHRNFLLEVKRPGGKLSADQEARHADIQLRYGVPIAVADSVDALCNFLAQHERAP